MARRRADAAAEEDEEPVHASAPLLPELRPVLEPLPDLALEAALRRVVEGLPAERLGEVVLAGEGVGLVVVVAVAGAVALLLHERRSGALRMIFGGTSEPPSLAAWVAALKAV